LDSFVVEGGRRGHVKYGLPMGGKRGEKGTV